MSSHSEFVTGIGWYAPDQWCTLKALAADPGFFEHSYEQWLAKAEETRRTLSVPGRVKIVRVWVDVHELMAWCRERGLPIDGVARARFIQERTARGLYTDEA